MEGDRDTFAVRGAGRAHDAGADTGTCGTQMAAILDAVDVPVVVVGPDCRVSRFNHAAAGTLGLQPADLHRLARDIPALGGVADMEQLCRQAMGGIDARRELQHGDRWFLVRVAPCGDPAPARRGAARY